MDFSANSFINSRLQERIDNNSYRTLSHNLPIDFCSNDYLGFAQSKDLKTLIEQEIVKHPNTLLGATGSRLLAGNNSYIENKEKEIAFFHNADAGLIFNSGYDANLGLFSSLPQKGDTIICDALIHACIIDGTRLSYANRYTFEHNNLNSLEEKLKHAKGNIFIAVESVYSMDGDQAPLIEIVNLAVKYNAHVIVDEAHATGVFGEYGRGLVCELNLEDKIFARVMTFGKALGSHGAIVLGAQNLRNYLINFARSFIYTTALPFHNLASILCAYSLLKQTKAIEELHQHINYFNQQSQKLYLNKIQSNSSIQSIVIGGNKKTKAVALSLQKLNLDVRPILSPTVAEGSERLRICLHSFNSKQEIDLLLNTLASIAQ